ncbi:MAG TPA: rhodanese-like domain-containing protein [bacterium]|nr:rhodanese-like domain-containing protein [bacterium]HPN34155.1 rhodanese-like domain-containing protein [bacterium]
MRNALREAFLIFMLAAVIGAGAGLIHPGSVHWSWSRPVRPAVQDSTFALDLPTVDIAAQDSDAFRQPRLISREALLGLLQRRTVLLIDSRSASEYQGGHLPGALSLPVEELGRMQETLQHLPSDRWLVTYCEGPPCDLSHQLAQVLVQSGYRSVAIYDAGLNDWLAGGGALSSEKP